MMLAYVELRYGPAGIWAQPFVHPDAPEVGATLGAPAAIAAQPAWASGVPVRALLPILAGAG